jgi:hypothetical protein
LWKEAADACSEQAEHVLAACASEDFPVAVRALTEAHGQVPRPAAALRACAPALAALQGNRKPNRGARRRGGKKWPAASIASIPGIIEP